MCSQSDFPLYFVPSERILFQNDTVSITKCHIICVDKSVFHLLFLMLCVVSLMTLYFLFIRALEFRNRRLERKFFSCTWHNLKPKTRVVVHSASNQPVTSQITENHRISFQNEENA